MLGLDISEHNGYIDFSKMKREKPEIEFFILRLGWIGNKSNHTMDRYFEDYYKNAKANGYKVGVYIYNYCKTLGAMQNACEWILEKIKGKTFELPVYIDQEDSTIISSGKSTLTTMSKYFCNFFKNYGYNTGVYANPNWFKNYLNYDELKQYNIWLAEWSTKLSFKGKVDIWQYSNKYMINGKRFDVNRILSNINYTQPVENNVDKMEVYVDMKQYKNGSTKEPVYSDTALSHMIGALNPHEVCNCLGIVDGRPIVEYKVDNSLNCKVGFVRWLGGVQ